jgi:hypothetical protein
MRWINRPVATFVIVTAAPTTAAPDGSLTVPTILPVPTVVWAVNDAEIVSSGEYETEVKLESSCSSTHLVSQFMAVARRGEAGP